MSKRISGVFGFVTNSSSMIFHFPRQLLEHPRIKKFIEAYGIEAGYVGDNLWHRGQCHTFAVTSEQKEEIRSQLVSSSSGYCRGPGVSVNDDSIVLIYGDEYQTLTRYLINLFEEASRELQLSYDAEEYN